MLSINQLMKYLRKKHLIEVKSWQKRDLQNIGYYHGFKGYRFIRKDNNKIKFSSLDEIIALNKFDLKLKTILYPKVMFIENALKSYFIEALLNDSKSENFEIIYNKSLTAYRNHNSSSDKYKEEYVKRMNLKGKINAALLRDYKKRSVVAHFFNKDKNIPIWAIFETLSLGEFGTMYDCSSNAVKLYVSKIMRLPTNLDSDGMLTKFFVFTIKDLRNAIAHNNIVFDTRFKTGRIHKRLVNLLEKEVEVNNIDFDYIDSYIIMIIYFLIRMGETKKSCNELLNDYLILTEKLKTQIPIDVYHKILGTQHKSNITILKKFIKES